MSSSKCKISKIVDIADRKRFDILCNLSQHINWNRENERADLVRRIMIILGDEWQGKLPNLGLVFRRKEIDTLLKTAVASKRYRRQFIDLVVRTGYRDVPKLDRNQEPHQRRTTAIHMAARCQFPDVEAIGQLFRIYASHDVNYVDDEGATHFHVACELGCDGVVKSFLEAGQNPNCSRRGTGDTPLNLALDNDRKGVARLLLYSGANPNRADGTGSTALHIVCKNRHAGLAELLFEACDQLRQPVQLEARDNNGFTPLHSALLCRNKKLAELLLRRGADPNAVTGAGDSPLHIIYDSHDTEWLRRFVEICDELVLVDARDQLGNTPLHLALEQDHEDMLEALLRLGADPNCANGDGVKPVHLICRRNGAGLARTFFEIGRRLGQPVQVDARDCKGRTPLQLAVARFNLDMIDALVDHGRADLESFEFPDAREFRVAECELKFAAQLIGCVERLEAKRYWFKRKDLLTIMRLFDKHQLFEVPADLETRWYDDDEFRRTAKRTMIYLTTTKRDANENEDDDDDDEVISLHKLLKSPADKIARILIHRTDYKNFLAHSDPRDFPEGYMQACLVHLCEVISRRFFRRWSLEAVSQLSWASCRGQGLPRLCCDKITENLRNEDLFRVFLAVAGESAR